LLLDHHRERNLLFGRQSKYVTKPVIADRKRIEIIYMHPEVLCPFLNHALTIRETLSQYMEVRQRNHLGG